MVLSTTTEGKQMLANILASVAIFTTVTGPWVLLRLIERRPQA